MGRVISGLVRWGFVMIEKRWPARGPYSIVAPGTSDGKLVLTSALGLHVKQRIQLKDTFLPTLALEIKRVIGPNKIEVGEIGASISQRTNVSSYGVTSSVFAPEQPRNDIPLQEISRAIYEEEPAVARRVIWVDPYGDYYTIANPVPVSGSITVSSFNYDAWTETYDCNKDLSVVKYYLLGNLIRTITLTRDQDGDIISGTRI